MARKYSPRQHHPQMGVVSSQDGAQDTWLEGEDMCGYTGAKVRRCQAINAVTGKLQVVRCGIPDTFSTIPCRGGGYIDIHEGAFRYNPPNMTHAAAKAEARKAKAEKRREKMICWLVDDQAESARNDPGWVESVFRDGHRGFGNYTDAELRTAMEQAGYYDRGNVD